MRKDKGILILAESFPPVLNSAARLFSELAETLSLEGFDVVVITEKPSRYLAAHPHKSIVDSGYSQGKSRIIRIPAFSKLRSVLVFRYFEQLLKMFMYLIVGLFYGFRRDVIVYSPPLPLAVAGIVLSKLYRRRSIINVQDLYPETAIQLGAMKNKTLIYICRAIETWIYKHANKITVHSSGNKDQVIARSADPSNVQVVHNWVDLKKYNPGPLLDGFRRKHNLGDRFVVSYAGVLGLAQDTECLLQTAVHFRENENVLFVIAGGGKGHQIFKKRVEEERLTNVMFLLPQVEEEYIKLLRSSDICLVTLAKELLTPAIPGKLQSIMAVGRPVVCGVPSVSGAKAIIEEAGCGIWIDPNDRGGLVRAIYTLIENDAREEIGKRGRVYAQKHFDRDICTKRYIDLLLTQ